MKKILLAGSSGLIGREVIALASHYNIQLTALFRSTPQFDIDKSIHQVIISDWHNQDIMLDLMKDHDELICTIGTTIKKAGSQKAFEDTDIGIVTLLANYASIRLSWVSLGVFYRCRCLFFEFLFTM